MAERTTVEVLCPLARLPKNDREKRDIFKAAFTTARNLVNPGHVLGISKVIYAETIEGQPALKVQFAVEAPETIQRANGVKV